MSKEIISVLFVSLLCSVSHRVLDVCTRIGFFLKQINALILFCTSHNHTIGHSNILKVSL